MNTRKYASDALNNSWEALMFDIPPSHMSLPCSPTQHESQLIDSLIRNQTKATVYTTNKYQEHGLIRAHDDDIIVIVEYVGDFPKLMYKHAISTIEQDRDKEIHVGSSNFPDIPIPDITKESLKSSGLEEFWLGKFIRNRSKVTIVTSSGYQEHGIIIGHDNLVVSFIRYETDTSRITYKNAISTIIMRNPDCQ